MTGESMSAPLVILLVVGFIWFVRQYSQRRRDTSPAGPRLDIEQALNDVEPPGSFEEALAPENNHVQAEHPLVINYRDAEGHESWRVVSDIHRGRDYFTACCHWRYGEPRTFRYDRLIQIINPEDGEIIPLKQFKSQRRVLFGRLRR